MDRLAGKTLDISGIARSLGTVLDFAAGDTLFREGDRPRCMYVLLDGQVLSLIHI